MSGAAIMMPPEFGELRYALGGVGALVLGAIALWVRGSKARAQVSGDSLQVAENASKGGWITQLERRVAESERQRAEAEQRERETYTRHMADLQEIAQLRLRIAILTEQRERMKRRQAALIRMLRTARPDLAADIGEAFDASGPMPLDEPIP